MLPKAFELLAAWGFSYNTMLTWSKQPHLGMGSHFRGQTEHVLFGIRGRLHTRRRDISTLFEAPTSGHSVKPERFYEIVRAASFPPYGEAFQRTPRPDFENLFSATAESYSAADDMRASTEFAYQNIRQRVARGGKGWRGYGPPK
jgi:N6-adenosine-specific RNA methylase IME4